MSGFYRLRSYMPSRHLRRLDTPLILWRTKWNCYQALFSPITERLGTRLHQCTAQCLLTHNHGGCVQCIPPSPHNRHIENTVLHHSLKVCTQCLHVTMETPYVGVPGDYSPGSFIPIQTWNRRQLLSMAIDRVQLMVLRMAQST